MVRPRRARASTSQDRAAYAEVEIETKGEQPKVINIMDALKKSMTGKGQVKVRDAVHRRMGKEPTSKKLARKQPKPTGSARRSVQ